MSELRLEAHLPAGSAYVHCEQYPAALVVSGQGLSSTQIQKLFTMSTYCPKEPIAMPLPPRQIILRISRFVEFYVECKSQFIEAVGNNVPL